MRKKQSQKNTQGKKVGCDIKRSKSLTEAERIVELERKLKASEKENKQMKILIDVANQTLGKYSDRLEKK